MSPEERRALITAPLPTVRIVSSQARFAGSTAYEHNVVQTLPDSPSYFERAILASDRGTSRHVSARRKRGE